MSHRVIFMASVLMMITGTIAFAELQNVEVGGSIRIRGNYYNLDTLGKTSFVEQRTRLNVNADFTQELRLFIEFDYYSGWGDDFRSNYLTGADFRSGPRANDVALHQGYIEARNLWGAPIAARVGRQELALGSQWLVGANDVSARYRGLAFDALRLTFANDNVSLDAIAAKLRESHGDFLDDDVDFYALYASYLGVANVMLDAYWLFLRDDEGALAWVIGGDDVNLHTVGVRLAGAVGGFDFDLESAYQFGSVYGIPNPRRRIFAREADVDFDAFAVNTELGYTFDIQMQPRVFGRFAWLGGGKPNRSCWHNNYDMPFNRLFSNVRYSEFLDVDQTLSNVLFYSLGLELTPTESFALKLTGAYFHADNTPRKRTGVVWRKEAGRTLGWELALQGDYHYSEDLVVRAGYAHFFGNRGLEASGRYRKHGLAPINGDRRDHYDYLFVETDLSF